MQLLPVDGVERRRHVCSGAEKTSSVPPGSSRCSASLIPAAAVTTALPTGSTSVSAPSRRAARGVPRADRARPPRRRAAAAPAPTAGRSPRSRRPARGRAGTSCGRAEHAGQRLDPDARVLVERVRQRDRSASRAAARRSRPARSAARRTPRRSTRALRAQRAHAPAGNAVHHRDALAALELARDLVAEHGAGSGAPELLHVGAAETARHDADERAGSGRLRQVGELGQPVGVEDDRAHRPIVGGTRGRLARYAWARERDEPAGRDAAERRLARLPGPHEHGQQLLTRRGREEAVLVHRQRDPPVGAGLCLRRDRELRERHGRRIDERTRDRAAATRRDVEAERHVVAPHG